MKKIVKEFLEKILSYEFVTGCGTILFFVVFFLLACGAEGWAALLF